MTSRQQYIVNYLKGEIDAKIINATVFFDSPEARQEALRQIAEHCVPSPSGNSQ